MEAILNLAAFLELSTDDVVQEDAAVGQLEYLAGTLDELADDDRQVFADYVRSRLVQERQSTNQSEYAKFLESFLEMLEDNED